MKEQVKTLEADIAERGQLMELKDATIIKLEDALKSMSDKAIEEQTLQTLKIRSLEAESKELKELKDKVKDLSRLKVLLPGSPRGRL